MEKNIFGKIVGVSLAILLAACSKPEDDVAETSLEAGTDFASSLTITQSDSLIQTATWDSDRRRLTVSGTANRGDSFVVVRNADTGLGLGRTDVRSDRSWRFRKDYSSDSQVPCRVYAVTSSVEATRDVSNAPSNCDGSTNNSNSGGSTQTNRPPIATIASPTSDTLNISVGTAVYFDGVAVDPDGTTQFSYLWNFAGAAPNSAQKTPGNITFSQAGTYRVTLTVADALGAASVPVERVITVGNVTQNAAPVINSMTPGNSVTIDINDSILFTADASDPENNTPLSYFWNFDGGAPNSRAQNPGPVTFTSPGIFNVSLKVSDSLGNFASANKTITVRGNNTTSSAPNGTITSPSSNVTVQVGDSVDFRGSASDPGNNTPLTYVWNFDGAAPNAIIQNPGSVTFNNTGTFNVRMTATDSLGNEDPTPALVTVTVTNTSNRNQAPNSVIVSPLSDLTINVGDRIDFRGAGFDPEGQSMTYYWDFNGGASNVSSQNANAVQFNNAGVYNVRLIVRDSVGLADSTPAERQITVRNIATSNQPPESMITSPTTNITINEGESVSFTGFATDPENNAPMSYVWNFDGAAPNSTQQNPGTVQFSNAGAYRVTFTATDSRGVKDPTPAERVVTVNAANSPNSNQAPNGVITSPNNNLTIDVGATIRFESNGTDPEGSTNLSYRWTFDGAVPNVNTRNPGNVTFNQVGTYRVRLTVTDPQGASDPTPAERLITVVAPNTVNQAPVASIDAPVTDRAIAVGNVVYFSGSAHDPDGNTPLKFFWDFDGIVPNMVGEIPGNVTFNREGTYRVRLIVADAKGLTNSNPPVRTITVGNVTNNNQAPSGNLISPSSNKTINAGDSLYFTASGSDPDGNTPLSYRWDFGGAAPISTSQRPGDVTFNTPGVYSVTMTVTDSLGLSDPTPESVTITVLGNGPVNNNAPNGQIVNPTSNMAIYLGDTLYFSGNGTDPDGDSLTYFWNFGGAAGNSTQRSPGNVTFNQTGNFTITFTVTDSKGLADPTPASITVSVLGITPSNSAPNAIIDTPAQNMTISAGTGLYFTGRGTDPDGDSNLTYLWTFDGASSNSTLASPGAVYFNNAGTYAVTMNVTDSQGLSDPTPATRVITVTPVANSNLAPDGTITSPTGNVSVNVGQSINFAATGTDPDNNTPMMFFWNFNGGAPNALSQNPGNVTFTQAGVYQVQMTVTDALGASDPTPATVWVTVNDQSVENRAPNGQITSPGGNRTINVGESIAFNASATDPDGTSQFSYLWNFGGAAANSTQRQTTVTFYNAGTYRVTLSVADNQGLYDPTPAEVTITVQNPTANNQAPNGTIIEPSGDIIVNAGDVVNFLATGYDVDGNTPLMYHWSFGGNVPDAEVHNPGNVTFSTPGTYQVSLAVMDSLGLSDPTPATRTIVVRAIAPDTLAPSAFITSPASDVTISEGTSLYFNGYATDPDNDTPFKYLWNFDGAVPNSLNATPGNVMFAQAGTYRVQFQVTDADGLSDPTPAMRTITVTRANQPTGNQPPAGQITQPSGNMTVNVGGTVYFSASATDPENNTPFSYRWNFDGAVPSITSQTPGNVTFNRIGTFRVRMTVTDSQGFSDPTPVGRLITVQSANTTNQRPTATIISPTSNTSIVAGQTVTFAGSGTDPDGHLPLTFYWDFGGAMPNVVGANPGNVTFPVAGTYTVTLKVADSLGMISTNVAQRTITVGENTPTGGNRAPFALISQPATNRTINVGESVYFDGGAVDPDGDTNFSYAWIFPNVTRTQKTPGNFTFNEAGSFVVQLYVTDSHGLRSDMPAEVTITVGGSGSNINNAPNGIINTPSADITIPLNGSVNFSGSGYDPDGDTITYRWNLDGAAANSTQKDPGPITFYSRGVYHVTLTVTDSRGLSDQTPAVRMITVE